MLKKEAIEKIKSYGFDIDALTAAIKADAEVDVTIPEFMPMTEAQLTARDEVKMTEGKKAGEREAAAIAKREFSKHGITVEADRFGDMAAELKKSINATGDEKIRTLTEQNAALIKDNTTYQEKMQAVQTEAKQAIFQANIISKLPKPAPGLTPHETVEVMKMRGFGFEQTDNGEVITRNGQPLKDPATHAPLPFDAGITLAYKELKWDVQQQATPPQGRGTGQRGSGTSNTGFGKMSDVREAFKAEFPDKDPNTSREFIDYYAKAVKENPQIDPLN